MIFFYLKNILFFDQLLQNPLFIWHFVTRRYLISQLHWLHQSEVPNALPDYVLALSTTSTYLIFFLEINDME